MAVDSYARDLRLALFRSGFMSRPLQGPEEVFAMAVLLGDLFPSEWPSPGRARAIGKPHPPPPGMGVHHGSLIDRSWNTRSTKRHTRD